MPRTGRVLLPNHPHHIVQRGHYRQVVFHTCRDYEYYLDTLREWKTNCKIKVYAYCLMTNHIHLLLEPPENTIMLSLLMKRLAGCQAQYMNRRTGRHGSLWDGRYKSSPIQTERYLMACYRYVELNPVRAGIVSDPGEYRWSSYSIRGLCEQSEWLDEHPCYLSLGKTRSDRLNCYRDFMSGVIPGDEWGLIRHALQRGQLTGDRKFVDEVESLVGRRIEHRSPGNQPKGTKGDRPL